MKTSSFFCVPLISAIPLGCPCHLSLVWPPYRKQQGENRGERIVRVLTLTVCLPCLPRLQAGPRSCAMCLLCHKQTPHRFSGRYVFILLPNEFLTFLSPSSIVVAFTSPRQDKVGKFSISNSNMKVRCSVLLSKGLTMCQTLHSVVCLTHSEVYASQPSYSCFILFLKHREVKQLAYGHQLGWF